MFDTNKKSFKFSEPSRDVGFVTYEFKNYEGDVYYAYFDIQGGLAELSFENSKRKGFDTMISDGYVTEKMNTCREMAFDFMNRYGDEIDALWWQATPSRYNAYKRYFESQINKIDDLPYFASKMIADNYGVSGMVREVNMLEKLEELYHG